MLVWTGRFLLGCAAALGLPGRAAGSAECPPGTITTVTAPDGDYIAAFDEGYTQVLGVYEQHKSYIVTGMALGPSGRLYLADGTIIYRLEADGTATRIVGTPQQRILNRNHANIQDVRQNVLEDSVVALEAHIVPGALAFDEEGRLYFVDYINGSGARIARLEADGRVVTFAGTGEAGYSGDGGPARKARFRFRIRSIRWSSLVFDGSGRLLVADFGNGRIRCIDRQGRVTTLVEALEVYADEGSLPRWGEEVWWPGGQLTFDAQGRLYFPAGSQVFRWYGDGRLEVVAGSGERGFGGDGGLATEASLSSPTGLAVDGQGNLYISDSSNHRVRRVGAEGLIETLAGSLPPGHISLVPPPCMAAEKALQGSENACLAALGDGGPATEAIFWFPERLLLTREGDLLVQTGSLMTSAIWGGGYFSQLRRICRVVEPVPTLVEESVLLSRGGGPSSLRIYPNPFNPAVSIAFWLEQPAQVAASIYDALGQRIRMLVPPSLRPAGSHQFVWDGRDDEGRRLSSGVYFFKLSLDGATATHKLTLLR